VFVFCLATSAYENRKAKPKFLGMNPPGKELVVARRGKERWDIYWKPKTPFPHSFMRLAYRRLMLMVAREDGFSFHSMVDVLSLLYFQV